MIVLYFETNETNHKLKKSVKKSSRYLLFPI